MTFLFKDSHTIFLPKCQNRKRRDSGWKCPWKGHFSSMVNVRIQPWLIQPQQSPFIDFNPVTLFNEVNGCFTGVMVMYWDLKKGVEDNTVESRYNI